MGTIDVKLSYLGGDWLRQEVDLGHLEIASPADFELKASEEINTWFKFCGLPIPAPVPVLTPHHQIAQKIHGLTAHPRERIHDLVDLQVITVSEQLDLATVAATCIALFKFRKVQEWPPRLEFEPESALLYEAALENTSARPTLQEATQWFNQFISGLDSAHR